MKRIILLLMIGVAARQTAQAQTNLPPVKTTETGAVATSDQRALPTKGGGQSRVQALSEGSRQTTATSSALGSPSTGKQIAPLKTGGGSATKATLQIKGGGQSGAATSTANGKTATGTAANATAANGKTANGTAAGSTAGKAPLKTSDGGGGGTTANSTAANGTAAKTTTATAANGTTTAGKDEKLPSSEPVKKQDAGQATKN